MFEKRMGIDVLPLTLLDYSIIERDKVEFSFVSVFRGMDLSSTCLQQ